jgi:hypothetical protein
MPNDDVNLSHSACQPQIALSASLSFPGNPIVVEVICARVAHLAVAMPTWPYNASPVTLAQLARSLEVTTETERLHYVGSRRNNWTHSCSLQRFNLAGLCTNQHNKIPSDQGSQMDQYKRETYFSSS